MEQLLKQQSSQIKVIQKIVNQIKKDSSARKTKEYGETRLLALNNAWAEVEKLNAQIEVHKDQFPDNKYFKEKYYDQVESMYEQAREQLENIIRDAIEKMKISDTIAEQMKTIKRQMAIIDTLKRSIELIETEMESQKSRAYYLQKTKLLNDYWDHIVRNHGEASSHGTFKDDYFEQDVFTKTEQIYQSTLIKIQEKLEATEQNSLQQHQQNTESHTKAKLPCITIPTFNGDYLKWQSFSDLFNELIHKNEKIAKGEKLFYLKANLSGEANELIEHLQITNENYETAWNILNKRYNNKRTLVFAQIRTLLNQQILLKESAEGLKKLHDTTTESLHAIKNLGVDTKDWDPLIVFMLIQKLDKESRRIYEQSLKNPRELQSLQDFFQFLENRFQGLEAIEPSNQNSIKSSEKRKPEMKVHHGAVDKESCPICKDNHRIYSCEKFRAYNRQQRNEAVRKANLCINCLGKGHSAGKCKSWRTCKMCNKKHHTALHLDTMNQKHINTFKTQNQASEEKMSPDKREASASTHVATHMAESKCQPTVLLATVIIHALSKRGTTVVLRALVDQGSQASFITEDAAQRLGTQRRRIDAKVTGVGQSMLGKIQTCVEVSITPRFPSSFTVTTTALVLRKLTNMLPAEKITPNSWNHTKNLMLADPGYDKPGRIDIILGADVFGKIILENVLRGPPGSPVAQQTELGWILSGEVQTISMNKRTQCFISEVDIGTELRRFWETEELQSETIMTSEDVACESHFKHTYKRGSDGRYTVRIPFKNDPEKTDELSDCKQLALARLYQMERKFKRQPAFAAMYRDFMHDYLRLGHMVPATSGPGKCHYLPHHAVMKQDSTTTKLRVVFDASAKQGPSKSLNDLMLVGPQMQQNLISILIRWRKHKIVFMADIEKMYRQIKIDVRDQNFQRILWRDSIDEPIREFNLTTVTYGTASAPFLAIRTLQQLAKDEMRMHPTAAKIILEDTYVDDVVSGGNSLSEVIKSSTELRKLLECGGFNLRKWASNSRDLLKNIPWNLREAAHDIDLDHERTIKALGIHWNPCKDSFKFLVNIDLQQTTISKRKLLSESAKIFDPIGFLAPVTIKVKLLLQEVWMLGSDWDQTLPEEMQQQWRRIKVELDSLQQIEIPRWMGYPGEDCLCELHGFSDASERAYSAVVYLRTKQGRQISTCLLTAKTKVAPLKSKMSLPRLELCGATLLANLLKEVKRSLAIDAISYYAWTDSTIVLAWLQEDPHKWQTFVGNRVAEIQSITESSQWFYVKSSENPADIASRGIYPSFLKNHKVWWEGPQWLKDPSITFAKKPTAKTDLEKKRVFISTITREPDNEDWTKLLLQRYSSLGKLQRVLAYCKRFIHNMKIERKKRTKTPLTIKELDDALLHIIKYTQRTHFAEDIKKLTKGQELHNGSRLLSLTPFLDHDQILRVAGRLEQADIPYNNKHPIILPHKGELTSLVIDKAHKTALHGGNTLTLQVTRQSYWILNGMKAVKGHIHKCTRCHRHKAQISQQMMGMLPKCRVLTSPPFSHSGVDYAGPFDLLVKRGRGNRTYKGYISIFICLTTKAIHLEVVTDLTAKAFIAALKRFVSRRGPVSHLYSDNATNFVGANRILSDVHKQQTHKSEVMAALQDIGMQWHFIPPASPHFGGLWEAGVKSVKHHMRRVLGDTKLTYEEMCTLMSQIEACLNSRPLCPLSEDPETLDVLTPGHFLTGAPLLAVPQMDYLNQKPNLLRQWEHLERMHQEFWKRWSTEYIARLQYRPKWNRKHANIERGNIVLIKEENLPPSKWALGRVIDTHPGSDGLTRVVTLRTRNGELKRPITKVSLLPITDNSAEESSTPSEEAMASDQSHDNGLEQSQEPESQAPHVLALAGAHTSERGQKRPEKPESESTKHKRHKRDATKAASAGGGIANNLFSFCVLTLLAIVAKGEEIKPYQITQFRDQEGIYFEDVARVQFFSSEWNLLIFYDLSTYWNEHIGIRRAARRLADLCVEGERTGLTKELCSAIVQQISHQIIESDHIHEILYQQNENVNARSKRAAPFEIIGTITNKLFGILDQDFAEKYEEQIRNIRENEHLLQELLKNQTSITENTINVYKKNHQMVQNQLNELEQHLEAIVNYTNHSQREMMTTQTFNSAAVLLTLNLINFQHVQRSILSVITDTKHGRLNTLLLTPPQLKKQLTVIREHLPQNLKLPGDGKTKSLLAIYNSMHVRMRITKKNVLFDVNIPLLTAEPYNLYHLIPVPVHQAGKHIYVEPSTTHLAVNQNRDRFSPVTKEDLKGCVHSTATELICNLNQPIFTLKSNRAHCEMELLNNHKILSPLCKLKSKTAEQVWIKLISPSSWLFIMDEDTQYDVTCDRAVYPVILNGNGIIRTQPNCMINHPTLYIMSNNKVTDRLESSFVPKTQVISAHLNNTILNANNSLHLRVPQLTKDVDSNDLAELEAAIKQQKQHINTMPKLNSHDLHHYTGVYLLLVIIVSIGVYYKCRSQGNLSLENTTPAGSTTTHPGEHPSCINR